MRKEPSSQENVTEERQSDQILECSQENNVAHGHRKCTAEPNGSKVDENFAKIKDVGVLRFQSPDCLPCSARGRVKTKRRESWCRGQDFFQINQDAISNDLLEGTISLKCFNQLKSKDICIAALLADFNLLLRRPGYQRYKERQSNCRVILWADSAGLQGQAQSHCRDCR